MTISTPYIGFDKDARGVGHLWERFHAGLLEPSEPRAPYHQLLLDEWRRCSSLGVDAAMTMARRLSEGELSERIKAGALLLETAVPLIEDVGQFLDTIPGLMLLTDTSGCVLHVCGNRDTQERAAARSGIVKGSRWDESAAGTNGMGTALATKQPVHVFATEHFCEGWHRWSCSAAPIFDADGSTVVGIIDFTTSHSDFRDQTLALTVSLANSIHAKMALRREIDRSRLIAACSEASRHYPHDEMRALDHAGRPITHSPAQNGGERVLRSVDVLSAPNGDSIGKIVHLSRPPPNGCPRVFLPNCPPNLPLNFLPKEGPRPHPPSAPTLRFGPFVSRDADTVRMLGELEKIARADVNLLLVGETGTGKELIARHVHARSPRRDEPYLAINCGAISADLLESAFFGYVRGAFSGADPKGRAGYFESTRGGTLFLDEIGELPLPMQPALLRVLEDGSFIRVGSCVTQQSNCRVIAATHRNLEELVAAGQFRQDLYYRLKIVQKKIKPIRERIGDIGLLVEHFLQSLSEKHRLRNVRIHQDAQNALEKYPWPGNAREIRNVIEAAMLCTEGDITLACLPPEIARPEYPDADRPVDAHAQSAKSAKDGERQLIIGMLKKYRKVNHVAQALGLARSTLYRKFAELGIDQRRFASGALD